MRVLDQVIELGVVRLVLLLQLVPDLADGRLVIDPMIGEAHLSGRVQVLTQIEERRAYVLFAVLVRVLIENVVPHYRNDVAGPGLQFN